MNSLRSYPSSPSTGNGAGAPFSPRELDSYADDEEEDAAAARPLHPLRPPSTSMLGSPPRVDAGEGATAPGTASLTAGTPARSVESAAAAASLRGAADGFVPLLEHQSAAQVVDRLRWWRVSRLRDQPLPLEHCVLAGNYANYSGSGTRPLSRRLTRALQRATARLDAEHARRGAAQPAERADTRRRAGAEVSRAAALAALFRPRAASEPCRSRVLRRIDAARALADDTAASPLTRAAATAAPAPVSRDPLTQRLMAVAASPGPRGTSPPPAGSPSAPMTSSRATGSSSSAATLAAENTAAGRQAVVLHNPARLVLFSRHMAPERAIVAARLSAQDIESGEFMTDRPEIFALTRLPLLPFEVEFYRQQLRDISLLPASRSHRSGNSTRTGRRSGRLRAASLPALPCTRDLCDVLRGRARCARTHRASDPQKHSDGAKDSRAADSSSSSTPLCRRVSSLQDAYCFNPLVDCIGAGAFSQVYAAVPILRGGHAGGAGGLGLSNSFSVGSSEELAWTDGAAAAGGACAAEDRNTRDESAAAKGDSAVQSPSHALHEANDAAACAPPSSCQARSEGTHRRVRAVAIKVIARRPRKDPTGGLRMLGGRGASPAPTKPATDEHAHAKSAALGADHSQRRELVEIEREIAVLRRLRHTGCSRFYEALRTPEEFVISMRMHRGSVDARQFLAKFGPPTEARAALMVYQLLETLQYLHNEFGLLHRDIKLENMLVSLLDSPVEHIQQVLGPDVNKTDHAAGAARGRAGNTHAPARRERTIADEMFGDDSEEESQEKETVVLPLSKVPRTATPSEHTRRGPCEVDCRSLGFAETDAATQMLRVTLIDFGLARRLRYAADGESRAAKSASSLKTASLPKSPSSLTVPSPLTAGRLAAGWTGDRPVLHKSTSRVGMPSPMPSTANMLMHYYGVEDEDEELDYDDDDDDAEDAEADGVEATDEDTALESEERDEFSSDDESLSDTASTTSLAQDAERSGEANATTSLPQAPTSGIARGENLPGSSSSSSSSPHPPPLSTFVIAEQQQQQQLFVADGATTPRALSDVSPPACSTPYADPANLSAQATEETGPAAAPHAHSFPSSVAAHASADATATRSTSALTPGASAGQRRRQPGGADCDPRSALLSPAAGSAGRSSNKGGVVRDGVLVGRSLSTCGVPGSTGPPGGTNSPNVNRSRLRRTPHSGGSSAAVHASRHGSEPSHGTLPDDEDSVTLLLTPCGTERYLPPEVLDWIVAHGWVRRPTTVGLAKQMDTYAVGTVAYVLLSGCFPFNATSRATLAQQQRHLPRCNSSRWDGVSAAAIGFVRGLLEPDPQRRLTARQALQHPFMREAAALAAKLGLVPRPYGQTVRRTPPGAAMSNSTGQAGATPLSGSGSHATRQSSSLSVQPPLPPAVSAGTPSSFKGSLVAYTQAFRQAMCGSGQLHGAAAANGTGDTAEGMLADSTIASGAGGGGGVSADGGQLPLPPSSRLRVARKVPSVSFFLDEKSADASTGSPTRTGGKSPTATPQRGSPSRAGQGAEPCARVEASADVPCPPTTAATTPRGQLKSSAADARTSDAESMRQEIAAAATVVSLSAPVVTHTSGMSPATPLPSVATTQETKTAAATALTTQPNDASRESAGTRSPAPAPPRQPDDADLFDQLFEDTMLDLV